MASRQRRDLSLTPATAKELKALAEITPSDIVRAGQEWKDNAPREFKDILDAVEEK